MSVIQETRRVH